MSSPLKPIGMVALVLGVWGFTVFEWGITPPEASSQGDASAGPSALSSAEPAATAPRDPRARRAGPTPFGRPVDESEEDHQADLERIREKEAKKAPGAVRRSMHDLKDSVIGGSPTTRGNEILPPRDRPPKSYYEYTPREVCVQMKLNYPEHYKNLDCGAASLSSPYNWND
jgi:hypothetical protein